MAEKPGDHGPLICLAASGGGHLRQLLQLQEFWRDHRRFFVTEDTPLGRSLAEDETVAFLPHFALGQARLGQTLKMLVSAARNCLDSLQIITRRRPDWVITTGAGSQIFVILWARLFGAQIVLIDSFARFDAPSAFARVGRYLAHHIYAQAEPVGAALGAKAIFNPVRILDSPPPVKEPLVLATVGATLPFPRLTNLVFDAKKRGAIGERVVLQTGDDSLASGAEVETIQALSAQDMKQYLQRARIVICHGGTGSILSALEQHCHVIVIPRRAKAGEHYDDHQSEIAKAFAARGLVQIAHCENSLAQAIENTKAKCAQGVTSDYGDLVSELEQLICSSGS